MGQWRVVGGQPWFKLLVWVRHGVLGGADRGAGSSGVDNRVSPRPWVHQYGLIVPSTAYAPP